MEKAISTGARGGAPSSPKGAIVPGFDLDAFLAERRPLVDAELERALDASGAPEPLASAMRYAVLGEGKRLRPILALAAAEAVGGAKARDAALPLGCAVELIHAYSLVHDDLPAMDDDDLRRGRPTVHKKFDEAVAILAGDALQTLAFSLAAQASAISSRRRAMAVAVLAAGAGANGMCGGQMLDLAAEGRYKTPSDGAAARPKAEQGGKTPSDGAAARPKAEQGGKTPGINLAKLETLASKKTGALIAAAAEMGAIAGGAGPKSRARLAEYGASVGLAFQIADDLLDAEGDASVVGKKTGKDVAKGKVTFPAVMGLDGARRKAHALATKSQHLVARFDNEGGLALAAIAQWAVSRNK